MKRLIVLAFGLEESKLSSTPTVLSATNFLPAFFLLFSCTKKPSESKQQFKGPSPKKRDDPAVEKPNRTSPRGCVALPSCLPSTRFSTIRASKRYLPDLMPVSQRTEARRYDIPPSDRVRRSLPPAVGITFMVESSKLSDTFFTLALLSAGASTSCSLGGSGSFGSSFISTSSAFASPSSFFASALSSFFSSFFSSSFVSTVAGSSLGAIVH
mmetsp:Transcript_45895/g.82635  ORF Transcript_45895/g.82635 Transcript_45895/m.82635 type:complete len:212 (-) Transcript_45895:41-676(-)